MSLFRYWWFKESLTRKFNYTCVQNPVSYTFQNFESLFCGLEQIISLGPENFRDDLQNFLDWRIYSNFSANSFSLPQNSRSFIKSCIQAGIHQDSRNFLPLLSYLQTLPVITSGRRNWAHLFPQGRRGEEALSLSEKRSSVVIFSAPLSVFKVLGLQKRPKARKEKKRLLTLMTHTKITLTQNPLNWSI